MTSRRQTRVAGRTSRLVFLFPCFTPPAAEKKKPVKKMLQIKRYNGNIGVYLHSVTQLLRLAQLMRRRSCHPAVYGGYIVFFVSNRYIVRLSTIITLYTYNMCVRVIIGKLLQSAVDILAHKTARRQSILCYCFVIVYNETRSSRMQSKISLVVLSF